MRWDGQSSGPTLYPEQLGSRLAPPWGKGRFTHIPQGRHQMRLSTPWICACGRARGMRGLGKGTWIQLNAPSLGWQSSLPTPLQKPSLPEMPLCQPNLAAMLLTMLALQTQHWHRGPGRPSHASSHTSNLHWPNNCPLRTRNTEYSTGSQIGGWD